MSISGVGGYQAPLLSTDRKHYSSSPTDLLALVNQAADSSSTSSNAVKSSDFTSMTPKEMKGLADQLWREGKIDLTENLMLQTMGIPLGKLGPDGKYQSLSEAETMQFQNTPINYFEVGRGAIDFLEHSGKANDPQYGYDRWKNFLSVLDELQGSTSGIDLTA